MAKGWDGAVEVVSQHPLVVLARIESALDVGPVVERLLGEHAASAFVAVVPAEDPFQDPLAVNRLAAAVREFVFTDSGPDQAGSGAELALRAVSEFGVGQDFVYTVARLADAIDYALTAVRSPDGRGWEGDALLVVGSAATIDQARRRLG